MTAATLPIGYKTYNFDKIRLPRPNLWRDGILALGFAIGVAQALGLSPLVDGWIYFAAHLDHLYPATFVAGDPAYVYPPPMAQVLAPVHAIGFGLYQIALTTALFGALWYLAGRWSWAFVAAGVLAAVGAPVPNDFGTVLGYAMNGNIQLFLAVAVVMSVRHPAAWLAPILTKPTMGVGVLWFVFRREWRKAALAVAATAAVAAFSFALAPGLWFDFLGFTLHNSAMPSNVPLVPVPLVARLAMSTALLAWAAPRGHRWAVPVAAGWAIPLLYVGTFLAIWIGALRLRRTNG